jgi:hypothetical protein
MSLCFLRRGMTGPLPLRRFFVVAEGAAASSFSRAFFGGILLCVYVRMFAVALRTGTKRQDPRAQWTRVEGQATQRQMEGDEKREKSGRCLWGSLLIIIITSPLIMLSAPPGLFFYDGQTFVLIVMAKTSRINSIGRAIPIILLCSIYRLGR